MSATTYLMDEDPMEEDFVLTDSEEEEEEEEAHTICAADLPNQLIMRIIRESTQLKRAPYQGVVDYFNNAREVDFEPEEIVTVEAARLGAASLFASIDTLRATMKALGTPMTDEELLDILGPNWKPLAPVMVSVHSKHWIRWDPDTDTQPESVRLMYHDVFEQDWGPNCGGKDRMGNCIEDLADVYDDY